MKTIAFFNNKGGVGKTTLVYHLSYMFGEMGLSVFVADLDPQSNLTAMFLDEEIEKLWDDKTENSTIVHAVSPLMKGLGDVAEVKIESINSKIGLIVGDLRLSSFEDKLSDAWIKCSDGDEAAFRAVSAFFRIIDQAATKCNADVVLIDVGPNLGAINRTALIASDFVVMPVAPDLFSVQGLLNLGPALRDWREKWKDRLKKNPAQQLNLPAGEMQPAGYVVLQHGIRSSRPVKAYMKWAARIPGVYRSSVLDDHTDNNHSINSDPLCLGLLKHYQSLMPMAMEARKPIFLLKPADGAIGAHMQAVHNCYDDFNNLAKRVAEVTGVKI